METQGSHTKQLLKITENPRCTRGRKGRRRVTSVAQETIVVTCTQSVTVPNHRQGKTETFPSSQYGKALGMRGLRRREAGSHGIYSCRGFVDSQGFETLSFLSIRRTLLCYVPLPSQDKQPQMSHTCELHLPDRVFGISNTVTKQRMV